MSTIFTGTIADALKETLEDIIDDPTDGYERKCHYKKWMDVSGMEDHYEDDLEVGGPGLAAEKTEGAEIATGTIREGYITRYIARTFGLKIIVTEEALEDNKYPKVINAARRLKRAMYKTMDIDATNILVRAANTSYVGGDGLSLANTAHTLPHGGTFSTRFATDMSPSRAAVIVATSAIRKFPGHDGVTEGAEPMQVVCPTEQWAVWRGLTGSTHAPEAGQFNEINVVNELNLKVESIKYWTNTTTNWGIVTDVDNGFKFKVKRQPRSKTWVDEGQGLMLYSVDVRYARGWTDPRCFYFSNI